MTMARLIPLALLGVLVIGAVAVAIWWWMRPPSPLDRASVDPLYTAPLVPPEGPLKVYFLGHSLVGRVMPAMLEQLAPPGHDYASQLGWGAELEAHWKHPDPPLNGFDVENAHPRFRPAGAEIDGGTYDAVVMTEKVSLLASLRWHDTPGYLARWAERARAARPDVRLFLYETWHGLDVEEGWLERIDRDLPELWEGQALFGALARDAQRRPIHLIPGGQVMAEVTRRVESGDGVPGLARREDLFSKADDGTQDMIHFSDQGAYLIALVHYAVLYQRDPAGLPHALLRHDGSPADPPSPEAARLMQEVVWQVVTRLPRTGVPQAGTAAD